MNTTEALNQALKDLQRSSQDIEACTLFSEDGLVIASSLPPDMDEDHISAIGSAILSFATKAANELKRGGLEQFLIKGDNGYAITMQATGYSALTAITRKEAKLGLIFLDMKRAVEKIKGILAV